MPVVIGNFSAAKSSGEFWSRQDWRREWDSNPRYGFPYTRFPSERLQPLGHPSASIRSGTRVLGARGEWAALDIPVRAGCPIGRNIAGGSGV
jgi:hypothetical protein